MAYSLDKEPWVGVIEIGGARHGVSLREAIVDAHRLRGVDPGDPLLAAALYRLLLALVVDVEGGWANPRDWEARWRAGAFSAEVFDEYFSRHHERFDLFHPHHPFFQVAGLEATSGELKPVSNLDLMRATGNNVPLFASSVESSPSVVTAAEAAGQLLVIQGFDTAAIKTGMRGDPAAKAGKTTGNPTGPLGSMGVVIPLGRSLFESLLLNLPRARFHDAAVDLPAWRREPDPSWQTRMPTGVVDLLTWQSRRVRLEPTEDHRAVRAVLVGAGDRLESMPDFEPNTSWVTQKASAKAGAVRPSRFRSGHAAWRSLAKVLGGAAESEAPIALRNCVSADWLSYDYPLSVLCVGVEYGNQSAVIENVIADSIPLAWLAVTADDDGYVREQLVEVTAEAEHLRVALNGLASDLRRSQGAESVPWDKGRHPGDEFIAQLDAPTLDFLTRVRDEPDSVDGARLDWEQTAYRLVMAAADAELDGASTRTFLPHKQTNMSPTVAARMFRAAVAKGLTKLTQQREADMAVGKES